MRLASCVLCWLGTALASSPAFAQTNATPPADIASTVKMPVSPGPPGVGGPSSTDTTNAAVSAGGQLATGNSKLVAVTGNAKFDMRRGQNAIAVSLIGNFAEGFVTSNPTIVTDSAKGTETITPGSSSWQETTENLQGKLRYDRFVTKDLSGFLQLTGTHDGFQAIRFRLNVDPGFKYLFLQKPAVKAWGEAGYDFQYDDNFTNSGLEQSPNGNVTDVEGGTYLISQSDTIESGRLFAGFQYSVNKDVSLNMGLEYLQGFGGSGGAAPAPGANQVRESGTGIQTIKTTDVLVDPQTISLTGSRLNYDLLLAAKLVGALSLGVGFNLKYNSDPLPGKVDLDTATTLTLIYAYHDAPAKKEPEKEKTCPCSEHEGATSVPTGAVPVPSPGPAPLPPPVPGAPPPPPPAPAAPSMP